MEVFSEHVIGYIHTRVCWFTLHMINQDLKLLAILYLQQTLLYSLQRYLFSVFLKLFFFHQSAVLVGFTGEEKTAFIFLKHLADTQCLSITTTHLQYPIVLMPSEVPNILKIYKYKWACAIVCSQCYRVIYTNITFALETGVWQRPRWRWLISCNLQRQLTVRNVSQTCRSQ